MNSPPTRDVRARDEVTGLFVSERSSTPAMKARRAWSQAVYINSLLKWLAKPLRCDGTGQAPPGSSDETRPASARSRVEVVNAMMLSRNTSGATNLAQKLAHVRCCFGVPRVSKVLALTCFLGNYPWRRRSESKEGSRCFGSDAKGTPRQL